MWKKRNLLIFGIVLIVILGIVWAYPTDTDSDGGFNIFELGQSNCRL